MKENIWHALLGSFVRKGITYISGLLMAGGWINAELSDRLTTEAVVMITASLITFLGSTWLSYKNVILEFVKKQVALKMAPTSTLNEVALVASAVEDKKSVAINGIEDVNAKV